MSDTELLLKSEPPRRLEVFTGAGRRRWTAEQKAQIVAECGEAGASVSAVARRHGLTPQQLFGWRRGAGCQAEEANGDGAPFVRVVVDSGVPISPAARKSRLIEVVIGGATVRVPPGTDVETLEMVLRAVRAVT
jgi:transposase